MDIITSEEFWEDLLAHIEERRVIPVLGADLLRVTEQGREVLLYRAVAERLLARYGLRALPEDEDAADGAVVLRPFLEINDAICAIATRGRRVQDIYRPIYDSLRSVLATQPKLPQGLSELARIPAFDLFVTTTCDNLLARALEEARAPDSPPVGQILYAPNLPGDQAGDIPELRPSGYRAVLYLFGRASASPFYAVHEEDTLEFVYNLQAGRGHIPERMISEVRSRNLLLVGCHFADWLSRFLIRLANQVRLSGDRPKKEFLVDKEAARDTGLTLFFERFSQNTRVYPGDTLTFVNELVRRWEERNPAPAAVSVLPGTPAAGSSAAGEIFISYAHEDVEAARTLRDALIEIGANLIWMDKSELRPGDEWEPQIVGALKRCVLFLPLVSSTTEVRPEGFFRKEWRLAVSRSDMIQGRSFLLPIVIDAEFHGDASRYHLVPDRFRDYQFGHAPRGTLTDAMRAALTNALREHRRPRVGT